MILSIKMNTGGASSTFDSDNGSSYNPVKTFIVPDPCFEDKIALAWRYGNKFAIYPRSQSTKKKGQQECDNKIVNVRQEVWLFSAPLRRLVNEASGTFLALQHSAQKNKENSLDLLKISRQYRSVLRACIENLHEATESETDLLKKNDYEAYTTIFLSIECIWHLCEILYIDSIPGDIILPFLLEWVRFHFPCQKWAVEELLSQCEKGSETHQYYWDSVIGCVVQGRIDLVRTLLKLHTASETNEFKMIDDVLRTMPLYSIYGGVSAGEFMITWKHWRAESRVKLNNHSLHSQPNLELILRLVLGEYSAFELIRDKYESWFDLLGGWVLFTCPWARRYELAEFAHACAGMRSRVPARSHLDVIILALCECDLHQVIGEIQNISDNGWFATHLTDMLFHCGKLEILDKHQVNVTHLLRESLILEYGSLMFEHQSLWSVGLLYLSGCGTEGPRRAELLLERLPITSEARALRILEETRKYRMHGFAQSICACISAKHISRGRPAMALSWALKGRHSVLAGRAADLMLRSYSETGVLPATDLLLTLGPAMVMHDRLLLLGKYCEFHMLYKNREFKKAGKLLVSLLTSKISPDYFWDILLLDTLPLLESDEVIFSSSDTSEIMLCLELRANTLNEEKTDLLRLALNRNLARAFLSADDDPDTKT